MCRFVGFQNIPVSGSKVTNVASQMFRHVAFHVLYKRSFVKISFGTMIAEHCSRFSMKNSKVSSQRVAVREDFGTNVTCVGFLASQSNVAFSSEFVLDISDYYRRRFTFIRLNFFQTHDRI